MKKNSFVDFFYSKTPGDRRSSRAFLVTALVLAIIVLANVFAGKLGTDVTQLDISGNGLYKISDTSKELVSELDKDVELIIVSSGEVDSRITKFLDNYAALSSHLSVRTVSPQKDTSVLSKYDCVNGQLVINCEATGKHTAVNLVGASDSLLLTTTNMYTGASSPASFDAEGLVTSGVNQVTGDVSEKVYCLSGHGESDLPEGAASVITKSNIAIGESQVNLLMDAGGVPEDCSLLISFVPTADLADDELDNLSNYMAGGGNLMLILDSSEFANFNTLMKEYGLEMQTGFVGDTTNYYQNYVNYYGFFCIYPTLDPNSAVSEGIDTAGLLLYPLGMKQVTPERDTITVDPFMTTSDAGVLFVDENNYQQDSRLIMGATARETADGSEASSLTVFTAASLISDDITSSFPNMSNLDIFINSITANLSGVDSISIPAKSLSATFNTVTNYLPLAVVFVLALPLAIVIYGIVYTVRRKKK